MPDRVPIIMGGRTKVADFFGLTETSIARWNKDGCPGEEGNYDLYEICCWWAENKLLKRRLQEAVSASQDEEKALKVERLKQQVRAEDLSYAQKIGEVVPVLQIQQMLEIAAQFYRKAGEQLLRAYGDDAQAILLEATNDAESAISKKLDDFASEVESESERLFADV